MTQPADYTYPRHLIRPTRWLILTYVREYFRSHGRYPRVKDIARSFGIPSPHVYMYLRRHIYLQQIKVQRKESVRS